MKIQYDGQLLTTTVTVCYRGEVLELNDIIDTGSSHTVFSPLNTLKVEQVVIDVGILPKFHKRLLGLDILKTSGFILDLDKLELYRS